MKEIGSIPDELKTFFDIILPTRFRPDIAKKFTGLNESDFDTISPDMVNLIPYQILQKNNFFREFIIDSMDLTNSPVQNERIKKSKLEKKETGTAYLSPTESANNDYKMLARQIKQNKKGKNNKKYNLDYYKENKRMIKGSRKIVVPKFNISENSLEEPKKEIYFQKQRNV